MVYPKFHLGRRKRWFGLRLGSHGLDPLRWPRAESVYCALSRLPKGLASCAWLPQPDRECGQDHPTGTGFRNLAPYALT